MDSLYSNNGVPLLTRRPTFFVFLIKKKKTRPPSKFGQSCYGTNHVTFRIKIYHKSILITITIL